MELTVEQRRLVRENIGLVSVHLRRHLRNLSVPRRDREWEDLFQEGCIGLIRAAVVFREEAGIPFAAFALPRIHNAVSRALHSKFSTVRVPPERKSAGRGDAADDAVSDQSHRSRVYSMSDEVERRLADTRRHHPEAPGSETIGQRLRDKYERAVQSAADDISCRASRRGDRDKLVRVLTEERFLVPDEESRTALRQIARQTKSSYARVAQCDKQIGSEIRHRLEADPEFRELRLRARANPDGAALQIDRALERDLATASGEEFIRRLRSAPRHDRARLLEALVQASDPEFENVLSDSVARLAKSSRERLLQHTRSEMGRKE